MGFRIRVSANQNNILRIKRYIQKTQYFRCRRHFGQSYF